MTDVAAPVSIEVLSHKDGCAFADEWYQYVDESHFWMRWRFRVLLSLLEATDAPLDQPLRVLDIGGGHGLGRSQFEGAAPWTVDCADLNTHALESIRAGRGRTFFYDVLEESPELVGAYDVVLLLDVIEHIEETGPFVRASVAHLKPGGLLVVNVPALMSMYSRYDVAVGHLRRYTKPTLAAEIAGSGADLVEQRYWGFTMVPLLWVRRLLLALRRSDEGIIETGMKPPSRFANWMLTTLMRMETSLFTRPPVGSSLCLTARRTGP